MISLTNANTGKVSREMLRLLPIDGVFLFVEDGRVTFALVSSPDQQNAAEIKYQQLNPSTNFAEIVEEARSVVLAGGTMSPVSGLLL